MINSATLKNLSIPEGKVLKILSNNKTLWQAENEAPKFNYVSLGDSIAAGHAINDGWKTDYGTKSQYGEDGRTETVIVPKCYTQLIHDGLARTHSKSHVSTKSFAKSGQRVQDLLGESGMLNQKEVKEALQSAELVTICIGANDVLGPALDGLESYIAVGKPALGEIAEEVEANLAILNDDNNSKSYKALFDTLYAINPKAKYIFTTIYNPYKYLWIPEGKGKDGFFYPVLNTIPQITIDLGIIKFELDEAFKDTILNLDIIQKIYSRTNGLCDWAEEYVTKLNTILRNKINEYNKNNFMLADTKAVYDAIPDRPVTEASKHYNDLVNVEFTRGYNTAQMDWGALWEGSDAQTYWTNLALKHIHGLNIDYSGFGTELVVNVVEKVIIPNIDPHPEEFGHYALYRVFFEAFGLSILSRRAITFHANDGSDSIVSQVIVALDNLPAYTNINTNSFVAPVGGYHFIGWNTAANGSGTSYSDKQLVGLTSDLTLYAQWSNMYTVTYKHTNHTNLYGNNETGHMECYELWIQGTPNNLQGQPEDKLGAFTNGPRTYRVPYGTPMGVVVRNFNSSEIFYDNVTCRVYLNGAEVASGYRGTTYDFTLTGDTIIDFRWKIAGSLASFNAQSWEDCYITTT